MWSRSRFRASLAGIFHSNVLGKDSLRLWCEVCICSASGGAWISCLSLIPLCLVQTISLGGNIIITSSSFTETTFRAAAVHIQPLLKSEPVKTSAMVKNKFKVVCSYSDLIWSYTDLNDHSTRPYINRLTTIMTDDQGSTGTMCMVQTFRGWWMNRHGMSILRVCRYVFSQQLVWYSLCGNRMPGER